MPVTSRGGRRLSLIIALGWYCFSAAAGDLQIDHVTIISPERSSPLRDATVYIQDGRITSIDRFWFRARL